MAAAIGRRFISGPRFAQPWICGSCRDLSTTPIRLAGHNKWSTIKHDKAKNDSAKSKERQIISKEISQAVKSLNFLLSLLLLPDQTFIADSRYRLWPQPQGESTPCACNHQRETERDGEINNRICHSQRARIVVDRCASRAVDYRSNATRVNRNRSRMYDGAERPGAARDTTYHQRSWGNGNTDEFSL